MQNKSIQKVEYIKKDDEERVKHWKVNCRQNIH